MENGDFQKEVIDTLARLETKMNAVCSKQKDHENRLRSLEKMKYKFMGAFAIIAVIGNVIIWVVK